MDRQKELSLLRRAMAEAEAAIRRGDEPYGAVIATPQGEVISAAGNEENTRCDPTAHAEMLAIRKASEICGSKSLRGCGKLQALPNVRCCGAYDRYQQLGHRQRVPGCRAAVFPDRTKDKQRRTANRSGAHGRRMYPTGLQRPKPFDGEK